MQAVIMAGGKGTRLRPYTTTLPKPLVPVGDVAIMEVVVRQLAAHGCERIVVTVSHLAHLIQAYFGDGARWGVSIEYSQEDQPLSTVAPLTLVKDLPEDFLVMNGDILTDLDFGALYRHHRESGAVVTVATYRREVRIDFGVLEFSDSNHRVTGFREKPVESFDVSMGVYACNRRVLDHIPRGEFFGFDHLMHTLIREEEDVRAFPFDGYWLDIGRGEDFDRANEEFERLRPTFLPPPPGTD